MGSCLAKCCFSSSDIPFRTIDDSDRYGDGDGGSMPYFRAFRLDQLRAATNGFSVGNIISERGTKTPNVVYRGKLSDGRRVAIKRFSKLLWLEPRWFIEEARTIGNLRSNHLANLIGCCCEGNERLLVAEYMPNGTLANHLREKQPMEWTTRLRIALNLAQALEYCGSQGRALYQDLNASRVLLDETGSPRLSSFGLMMNSRDGESVVFSFGTVLLNLLSGTHIQPTFALNLISGKNFLVLMDSALDGHYSDQDAAELMQLVSSCLQDDARERPSLNHIVSVLSRPQMRVACWPDPCPKMSAPSNSPMDERRYAKPPVKQFPLTPLGDACLRLDLTSIHEQLDKIGYMGDDGVATELSFQMWNAHLLENLDSQNHGDVAFGSKDYETAIEFYTEGGTTVSPTVLARRCLCYLIIGMAREALGDAMQAQVVAPEWPIAFYLQAACLFMLRMDAEAQVALKRGTDLEGS